MLHEGLIKNIHFLKCFKIYFRQLFKYFIIFYRLTTIESNPKLRLDIYFFKKECEETDKFNLTNKKYTNFHRIFNKMHIYQFQHQKVLVNLLI